MQHTTSAQSRAVRRLAVAIACSTLFATTASVLRAQAVQPAATVPQSEETIKMLEFLVSDKGVSRATNSVTPADVKASLPGVSVE
eukprot:gene20604-26409_t